MLKNKKIWFVFLLVFILFMYAIFYKEVIFSLNGEEEVVVELNKDYKELGLVIKVCNVFKCSTKEVKVNSEGSVDTNVVGKYVINYYWEKELVAKRIVNVLEFEKPVIILEGNVNVEVCPNKEYVEEGFKAYDNYDLDLTEKVIRKVLKDKIKYEVYDSSMNKDEVVRKISYVDKELPVIILKGDKTVFVRKGSNYKELGYEVSDNCEDLSELVTVSGNINTNVSGTYELVYQVKDSSGNKGEERRKVVVYDLERQEINSFVEDLNAYFKDKNYRVSIGYLNLISGFKYEFNVNKLYYVASLIKILDALYVYEKMSVNDKLKDLVCKAISVSSNSAHKTLIDLIGFNNLRNYGVNMGALNTLRGTDNFGFTTVNDQITILKYLYNFINTNANGLELKNYFINDYYNYLKYEGSKEVLHKCGYYDSIFHDVGIILDEMPYILVVLTNEGNNPVIINDIAQKINELHNLTK